MSWSLAYNHVKVINCLRRHMLQLVRDMITMQILHWSKTAMAWHGMAWHWHNWTGWFPDLIFKGYSCFLISWLCFILLIVLLSNVFNGILIIIWLIIIIIGVILIVETLIQRRWVFILRRSVTVHRRLFHKRQWSLSTVNWHQNIEIYKYKYNVQIYKYTNTYKTTKVINFQFDCF